MKVLFISLLMLPVVSYADNCSTTSTTEVVEETKEIKTDVPSHLVGATICVKLADGNESCASAEKFKVVPRVQQFVLTKTKQLDKMVCKADKDKNRVSLLAGNGPREGLDRRKEGDKVIIESRVGATGGIQYQRLITEDISVGAQVQTNESVLINIGLDF